jgi:Asp-tRNA(Asn)/Glu-tRNA(Gln) amidotransferase A subunit family amidase
VILKDNFDTHDMATTAGSLALFNSVPPDDAYLVKALRDAGAIILAKSNMDEWAFSPYQTVSSVGGTTSNPYDLDRVPAGSSGGTAAAIAANFGVIGLGTDTGNSIRGPSSHCCLVGLRPTIGLTSRDGIIPLYSRNDVGGPMCRTVEDVARVLDVMAGYDPVDPLTKRGADKKPESYTRFLDEKGLDETRIGVLRHYTENPATDPEINALFNSAINDLNTLGATIIDPFTIPDLDKLTENIWCRTFKTDIDRYLKSLGENAPVRTLQQIIQEKKYTELTESKLRSLLAEDRKCAEVYQDPSNKRLIDTVLTAMKKENIQAFIFPTWSNPPRKHGDFSSPAGDNSQQIAPHTGMPAITVPMGFTSQGLPTGLQIVGEHFQEPILLKIAHAYEQATKHRKPPELFPELPFSIYNNVTESQPRTSPKNN